MAAQPLPPVVYRSARNQHPKYHLTLDCATLDRIRERDVDPADVLFAREVDDEQFFTDSADRACRACALEAVATQLLPRRGDEPVTFASMTAQTPLEERAFTASGRIRGTWTKSQITEVTASGADRLRRIGRATGYPVTSTVAGPALYGFVPVRAHRFAKANLRTTTPPGIVELPEPEVVTTAWALLCNQPPEMLAHFRAEQYYDDPWALAQLAATAALA